MTSINLDKLYARREEAKEMEKRNIVLMEQIKKVAWEIGATDADGNGRANLRIVLSSATKDGYDQSVNDIFRETTHGELVELATQVANKFATNWSFDKLHITADGLFEVTEIIIECDVHIWY